MPLSEQALAMMNQAQMNAQQSEAEARLLKIDRAMEYYEGRTDSETVNYFNPDLINQIAYANNNVTRRIMKRISQVHRVKPIITFPSEANKDVTTLYLQKTALDSVKMARAERLLNLLKGLFIKSTFRNDQLEIDIIKDFIPIFGSDPMQPIAVTFPVHASSEVTNVDGEVWAFWSAEEQFRYVKGGEIIDDDKLEGVNPYGTLPGVFAFAEGAPPETAFMDFEPAMDVIDTNLAINLALTEMSANLRFQNFDYPFLKGIKNSGEVQVSQDKFTELPPGVEMGMVGVNSHVPDTITGVNYLYKTLAVNYGLEANWAEGGSQVASGKALMIRNLELMDNRSGDLENWQNIWQALYQIRTSQFKYHFKKNLPETISIDFRETMKIQTEAEKREDLQWQVETGQTTYAQIMVDESPDEFPGDEEAGVTPLEQAQAQLQKNLAMTKELDAASQSKALLDLALGQKPEGELS